MRPGGDTVRGTTVCASLVVVLWTCIEVHSERAGVDSAFGTVRLAPPVPPPPAEPFRPSNARTVDGRTIPEDDFFPASRCASCHADTHRSWSESLHRNAVREPFYKESVDILARTRGI